MCVNVIRSATKSAAKIAKEKGKFQIELIAPCKWKLLPMRQSISRNDLSKSKVEVE